MLHILALLQGEPNLLRNFIGLIILISKQKKTQIVLVFCVTDEVEDDIDLHSWGLHEGLQGYGRPSLQPSPGPITAPLL